MYRKGQKRDKKPKKRKSTRKKPPPIVLYRLRTWTFSKNVFVVFSFLNSPCGETQKKKPKKKRKLIKKKLPTTDHLPHTSFIDSAYLPSAPCWCMGAAGRRAAPP
jgi:hypothetical protein